MTPAPAPCPYAARSAALQQILRAAGHVKGNGVSHSGIALVTRLARQHRLRDWSATRTRSNGAVNYDDKPAPVTPEQVDSATTMPLPLPGEPVTAAARRRPRCGRVQSQSLAARAGGSPPPRDGIAARAYRWLNAEKVPDGLNTLKLTQWLAYITGKEQQP